MSEEAKPVTELKTVLEADLKFVANGKTYVMEKKISIARRIECDNLIIELCGGGNLGSFFKDWKAVYEMANAMKFADIVVMAHNRMMGVEKFKERHDPVLALCALFINEVNEDRRYITTEQIQAKIADWEAEGIEYAFFFGMADGLMKNISKSSSDISPIISEEEKGQDKP